MSEEAIVEEFVDGEVVDGETPELSLEDALKAAWDEAEGSSEEAPEEPEPKAPEPDKGDESEELPLAAEAAVDTQSIPNGFKDILPDEWESTPASVKESMHKRVADFEKGIEKYRTAANQYEQFDKAVRPYQQLFAMNNVSPPQMVGQLMQVASTLQMGTPAQKAQLVANLTKQFGVDIEQLDSFLAGEPVDDKTSELDRALEQRLQPLQEKLSQYEKMFQQQHQKSQAQVANELQSFANNPEHKYFPYVREEMADILEVSARRGVQISLKDAYERACLMNPRVAQQIQRNQLTEKAAVKQKAASSIHGTMGGAPSTPEVSSWGDALSRAFDNAGRI